jgi:hypothetical protein
VGRGGGRRKWEDGWRYGHAWIDALAMCPTTEPGSQKSARYPSISMLAWVWVCWAERSPTVETTACAGAGAGAGAGACAGAGA